MNQHNATGEVIIDKLQGVLSTLRREADDLHRSKELAIERLRLARLDRESMEKTVAGMQDTLYQLKESTNRSNRELEKVEKEVERLRREVGDCLSGSFNVLHDRFA